MEIIQNYKKEHKEIKICRLCGCDNKENVDIFSMNTQPINNTDDLLNKILTVYPLVLYKDDPLPQHICLKCINNVSSSYQDIQQVLRQQNKWMSLTKAVQPEHKYFRILRAVENSTKATKESIKISFNIELNQAPLKKLVTLTSQLAQDSPINPNLRRLLAIPSKESHDPSTCNTNTKLIVNENVVKNIQSKLESNGFTIKRIKVATSTTSVQDLSYNTNSLDIQTITPSTEATVSCKYCKLKFSNLKILAQHQLIHLNLSTNKIFQKRLLPKNLRRGRLITINDSKTIRCLNCWRIYKDNKAILQHWSCGDCDFYCFICGKEFPQSPKLLREHIPNEHGISYRSAMRQFVISHSERIQPLAAFGLPLKMPTLQNPTYKQQMATNVIKKVNKYRKPPRTCTKNDDGTITCKVCHKVFDNFRSSNSHMRKHKPPTKYADTSFSSATKTDSYNLQDEYRMMQPTTSHQQWSPRQTYPILPMQKPSRPLYRVITKNGPLTGIKTKIVQKRQDFLASNKIRVKTMESLIGNKPSSSMSTANDDNLIVPELIAPIIKSEPIMENETFHNDSRVSLHNEYISSPSVIKAEPVTNLPYDETDSYLLCFICNQSFASNNDYQMHTMYVHNIH